MKKYQELKQAMKNTPPQRLAKIEVNSHFMHMIGVSIVCVILIVKGFWWIIFAFVFSLGVTYSQWRTAIMKYDGIVDAIGEVPYDYKTDKSFTRSRDHIIKEVFGKYFWLGVITPVMYFLYVIAQETKWYADIALVIIFLGIYIFLYFYLIYWLAKFLYDRRPDNG